MPMIATTIISSISVKPRCRFLIETPPFVCDAPSQQNACPQAYPSKPELGHASAPNYQIPSHVDDFRKIPSVFGWLWRQTSSAPAKSDTERLIAEGNAAEAAGDFARACALYREAARLSPGLARPHVNLGIALESRGDAAGAQAAYERTLAIEPANAAANYNLGKLFYSLGRHADAEQRVRQAIEARPAFPEARVVLGYTLHALGKLETAASELETGIAGRPQDEAARAALSTVRGAIAVKGALEHHQAGRIDAAQAGYEAALALDPHNAEALFNIAGIHA